MVAVLCRKAASPGDARVDRQRRLDCFGLINRASAIGFTGTTRQVRYPGFTITEHLGLLDDPGYRARWERKRAEYLGAGIRPIDENSGSERVLIETRDSPGGGLDAAEIEKMIERILM